MMPRLCVHSLYGPIASGLGLRILVGPSQLGILCDKLSHVSGGSDCSGAIRDVIL